MKKIPKKIGLQNNDYHLVAELPFFLPETNAVDFLVRARNSYKAFLILLEHGLSQDAMICLAQSYEAYLKMLLVHSELKSKTDAKSLRHNKCALEHFPSLQDINNDETAHHLLIFLGENYVDLRYLKKSFMLRGIREEDVSRYSDTMTKAVASVPIDTIAINRSQYAELINTSEKITKTFESTIKYMTDNPTLFPSKTAVSNN